MSEETVNTTNDNKPALRIKWTDEEIQFVIEKQKEGMSCGVIAKIMNELGMRSDCAPVTRNAVVGVWDRHREKLTKEDDLQSKTKLKKKAKKKEKPESTVGVIFEPSHHIEENMNKMIFNHESTEPRMTIENLRDKCCKFPFNDPRTEDFFYCGEPVDYRFGRSYCEFHYKVCYQPSER